MRAQRIHAGFHRIGAVLAVLCLTFAVGPLLDAVDLLLAHLAEVDHLASPRTIAIDQAMIGGAFLAWAAVIYAFACVIGLLIAVFARHEEISN